MDFNIEVRKKQLQSLDQYISSSKDKVHSILDYLGWNSKNVIEKEPTTVCSMNASHYVPVKNNDVHLKKCYFNSSGYSHDDRFLSEPVNTTFSIKLDNTKKIEVLNRARENNPKFKTAWNGQDTDPMTSDRWFTTFSSDERLAMYDYCVKNTEQPPVPSEFNIDVEDKKEGQVLTQQELLAKQRDAKRRRIKYKSVHTGRNKSHTEIMREVIANQMEQYTDYLITKTKIITDHSKDNTEEQTLPLTGVDISIVKTESANDVERPHSSISHYSNHSSNSWNKKDRSRYDKSKSYENEVELRRDYKHENRHTYSEQYDRSPRGRKRYTDSEDDYRHSRDKRKWRYKSDKRH